MKPTIGASPEEIAEVLEVIQRSAPPGPTLPQIADETGLSSDIVIDALAALNAQGISIGGSIPKDSHQSPLFVRFAHLRRL